MRKYRFGNARGFTLIELLIVIAIIGFLAAAILVAVDPVKRVQQSRDSKRWGEVNGLLNAILTKQVDDRSAFTGNASAPIIAHATNSQVIASAHAGVDCSTQADAPACPPVTLSSSGMDCIANIGVEADGLVDEYIDSISVDPQGSGEEPTEDNLVLGTTNSGYYIHKKPSGRIEIGSCYPDQSATISVKR